MEIVEFLEACLAEDEREALRTPEKDRGDGLWSLQSEDWNGCYIGEARVLREVAAKRAILAEHDLEEFTRHLDGAIYHHACRKCITDDHWLDQDSHPMVTFPCPTLRALASVYRDHPDFDPAWAVDAAVTT